MLRHRAAAATARLQLHSKEVPDLAWEQFSVELIAEVVRKQIILAGEGGRRSLNEHFIEGDLSVQAAPEVFGQKVKPLVTKLEQVKKTWPALPESHDATRGY